ncbi:MAG TPA: CAP domain-containing protein [Pyrinomonadaceae bacterium]|nr:CAP domain-containing protein [Pyrinomonadaceae bacterium]
MRPFDKLPLAYLKNVLTASLLLLTLCQIATAQNSQMRPVARLLADPVSPVASRPRTVSSTPKSPETTAVLSPSLDEANAIERSAFEKTNKARAENGLSVLVWDAGLCRLARAHSEDMARQGYFAHETPNGLQLKDRARAMGIQRFRVIGENIAYNKGYDDPGGFAVERWMNSGGHRANMLYVGFQASAIGTYISSDGSVYLTQVFINR